MKTLIQKLKPLPPLKKLGSLLWRALIRKPNLRDLALAQIIALTFNLTMPVWQAWPRHLSNALAADVVDTNIVPSKNKNFELQNTKNRDFDVYFGEKNPKNGNHHRVRFEDKKGDSLEMKLVAAVEQKHQISNSKSQINNKSQIANNPVPTTSPDSSTSPQDKAAADLQKQSADIQKDLEKIQKDLGEVQGAAQKITKEFRNITTTTTLTTKAERDKVRPDAVAANLDTREETGLISKDERKVLGALDDPNKDIVVNSEVVNGVDLEYEVVPKGAKESIIIKSEKLKVKSALKIPNVFTFTLSLSPGVRPRYDLSGRWIFENIETNEYVAHMEPAFMVDSNGVRSNDVRIKITNIQAPNLNEAPDSKDQCQDGNIENCNIGNSLEIENWKLKIQGATHLVTVTADPTWLSDPNRAYPVVIDPTILHDTQAEFTAGTENRVATTADPKVQLKYEQLSADESTVGLWHMEDNVTGDAQTITDSSGNGNNGTTHYGANTTGMDCTVTGKIGSYGCDFDGTDDYLSVTDSASISPIGPMSLVAWVKPTVVDSRAILVKDASYRLVTDASGNPLCQIHNGTAWQTAATSATALVANQWSLVTCAYDQTNLKVFVNGVETGTQALTTAIADNANAFEVGRDAGGTYTTYSGVVDEVAIFNRALSPEEIAAQASRRPYGVLTSSVIDLGGDVDTLDSLQWAEQGVATGDGETLYSDTSLVAQWNFNETSGTTADNAEGTAALDGTLTNFGTTGTPTDNLCLDSQDDISPVNCINSGWTANNALWPRTSPAALQFDGTDDYVSVTDSAPISPIGPMSLVAWVKPTAVDSRAILVKDASYRLVTDASGHPVCQIHNGTAWQTAATSATALVANQWSLVSCAYDQTNLKVYVNGVETGTQALTTAIADNANAFEVGRDAGGTYGSYAGVVDSVRIYSRALTATEILSNYNATNIEFQTRTGPDDGSAGFTNWEAWKPITSESQILSMDSDVTNWSWDNTATNMPKSKTDDTTTYYEGSGSLKTTFGAPQVDANTVALWHFDETNGDLAGSDVFDETTNNNDGEFNGTGIATGVVDGIFGKARQFNGTDDYVIVASPVTTATDNVTLEAWVKWDGTTGANQSIVLNGNSSSSGYGFYLVSAASDNLEILNGGVGWVDTNTTLTQGIWQYVVGVRDAGTWKVYLDGVALSVVGNPTPITPDTGTSIGARQNGGEKFKGTIDEVRISNTARSAEEIAEAYRAGRDHYLNRTITSTDLSSKTKLPFYVAADRPGTYLSATIGESAYANYQADANTVGLWHLEEKSGSGAYIKDSSSSGNDATPTGTTFVQGKIGKARSFNGTSDFISVVDSASISPIGPMSLVAWVKPTAVDSRAILVKNNSYRLVTDASGNPLCQIHNGTAWQTAATSSTALTANQWSLVTCAYDQTNLKVYVNGVETGTQALTTAIGDNANAFEVGRDAGGTYGSYSGVVDEVRISNTARTADEIRQAYEVGRRTHPITIDFTANLDSANLIADSADTSFTIDATNFGLANMGDGLYKGDTLIVKENYGGTEYIAQGDVLTINSSTGAVTIDAWDSGSTFPSSGFTANATVFKWQREFFDISSISPSSQIDAITQISLRVTDASQGATVWLDDFRSGGSYLSGSANCGTSCTASIASGKNRYFQYRAVLTRETSDVYQKTSDVYSLTPNLTQARLIYSDTVGLDDLTSTTYDTAGNKHLGSSSVNDTYFYDRTKDQFSYALDFDGTDDYVDVGNGSSLNLNNNFTIETWIKVPENAPVDGMGVVAWGEDISGQRRSLVLWNGGSGNNKVYFSGYDAAANLGGISSVDDNKWHHVAVTVSSSDVAKVYVDGIEESSGSVTLGAYTYSGTYIGATPLGDAMNEYFNGQIDEVAIFNTALSASQIKADYNARRISDSESGLVALYHFDLGRNTTAIDSVGANNGTLTNMANDDWVNSLDDRDQSPLTQQVLGVDPNWANGVTRQSYALDFDGTDYISVVDSASISPIGPISLVAWVKPTAVDSRAILVKNNSYRLVTDASGDPVCQIHNGTAWQTAATSSTALVANQWSLVTCAYDQTNLKVYVNGVETGTQALTTAIADNANAFEVGRDAGGTYGSYSGVVDEVAIFSDARTPAEIAADYRNRRIDDSDANLVGLWHFDEGADNTCSGGTNDVCDASSNTNDGALNNFSGTYWVTGSNAIMDNNAQWLALGSDSSVTDDSAYEIMLDTETTFKYRKAGASSWTTPSSPNLSSYPYATPAQIDSTGVYIGFDTANGLLSEEDHFDIASWALEAVSNSDSSEAMRGERNSFPEKSYLVAQNNYLDILDASDNKLWMRFPQGTSFALGSASNNNLSSVFSRDGKVWVTTNGASATGLYALDFNLDQSNRTNATDRRSSDKNLAGRATTNTYGSANTSYALVSSTLNDVHAATIQGKQFVAVAGSLGVSVINEAGATVYDYSDNTSDAYGHVLLVENTGGMGDLYADNDTTDALERWNNVIDDSADELNGAPDTTYDEASTPAIFTSASEINDLTFTQSPSYPLLAGTSPISLIYIAHDNGLTQLIDNRSAPTDSEVKYFNKDYITDNMIGDVRAVWSFNGTTGNSIANNATAGLDDKSVNTNNGTAKNANGTGMSFVTGVRGTAVSFDGTDDYLSVADSASISPIGPMSLVAWVKPTAVDSRAILVKNNSYRLVTDASGNPLCQIHNGTSWQTAATSSTALTANQWSFVSCAYDQTNLKVFINGVETGTQALTTAIADNANAFEVGRDAGGTYGSYSGVVDEPFITAEALTADQIKQLYLDGLAALNDSHSIDDSYNELAEDASNPTSKVTAISVVQPVQNGVTRPTNIFVGTNGAAADDGALSILDGSGNILKRFMQESGTQPAIVDNDISSISCSNDGVYCIIGTDSNGVTILYSQGDTTTSTQMRHGKSFFGGRKRPLR